MSDEQPEPKASDFTKGSRVRIRRSEMVEWIGRGNKKNVNWETRFGTVLSSGHGNYVLVRWDGNKAGVSISPWWLELIHVPKGMITPDRIKELEKALGSAVRWFLDEHFVGDRSEVRRSAMEMANKLAAVLPSEEKR